MWLEAKVIVDVTSAGELERRIFIAAMERRGWTPQGETGFHATFTDVSSEERVVQLVERDVCDSAAVSGIAGYDCVCLLTESELSKDLSFNFDNQDSDINLGHL